MLTSVSIARFKSYRQATLPLAPLTLLVGANASGKSNAIEALRMLSWLARGQRLDAILSAVHETDQRIRGSIDNLTYDRVTSFELGCQIAGEEWDQLSVEIEVSDTGMRIVGEQLSSPGSKVPLYTVAAPAPPGGHDLQVRYNNFARGGIKPTILCSDQQAVFTQLATPARFGGAHLKAQREIPRAVERYRKLLSEILFLDPSPRRMRDYSFKVERSLKDDGSNLSSVLFHLCEDSGQREAVLDFIRSLPEQDIRGIDFISTQRNEVMVQLQESFADAIKTWDAPVLSDGTLRVLAVAAALLSAPQGSLVSIEEIDNGVHPSRARMLLDNIRKVASKRQLRVLLTTHNPALLDSLGDSAVPDVVFCYRDPARGDSRLARLRDLPEYPEIVARGPLGTLLTRGFLDRVVKDPKSGEERQQESLRWVHDLRDRAAAS